MELTNRDYEKFYRSLYRIRSVEEEVARVYPTDKIQSPVHLSIGQEAVAVGVCEALSPADVVFGTYRGHALYLAKGGDLKAMIAELYCRATGAAGGKGGSMHLVDVEHGVMGTSAVVATGIPHAVGYADQAKYDGRGIVVACFFGDGAVDEGVFHESMNLAALRKAPVLFVCENNRYAIHTPQEARQAFPSIASLAQAYGFPVRRIAGGNVFEIYAAANEAVKAMRSSSSGPWFLECLTYRWKEHVGPNEDFHIGYRSRQEAEPWLTADPLLGVGKLIDPATKSRIEHEVEQEIRKAFEYAESSPFAEPQDLYRHVYAD